jgi:hypothetical protein
LLNFGKEEVRAQTTTVEKGAIAEKKKPALVEDRKTSAKNSESDIMKEEITEITPQKAKSKPKKLALSTSEESAPPKPTKSLKQPEVQKSNPHNEKQKSERKIIQKTSSSKLVKRPPSKAKKPYDSEEESSTKMKAKPASKPKSQSKTKKVQLDDSDLELIQKNRKVITKDDKSSIRKSKIKSTEQLSDSNSNSEPSELSYESESEYS